METLADFARRQVLDVSRQRAPMPRPAQCKLVAGLSSAGVAAQAGIAARDFVVEMNGEPAAQLVDLEYYGPAEKTWIFYKRVTHERIVVATTGIDPGLELQPTPEGIKATFDPAQPDYAALLELWRARDFTAVAALAEATLRATRSRATPALALLAAGLVETGRIEEGGSLAHEYLAEHSAKWTMDFTAVAFHAKAVAVEARGQRDEAIRLWEAAWDNEPFERTAQALERASGARPPKREPYWPGRPFPIDYRLPLLEAAQPGTAALADALGRVGEGQLLLVCALASYRVNGPYSRLLLRYLAWAPHFGSRLTALHVITERTERPQGRDSLFGPEDEARAAGHPLVLMHDADGAISGTLQPPGSPHVYMLDRAGTVVHEGELDGVGLWDALARLDGHPIN